MSAILLPQGQNWDGQSAWNTRIRNLDNAVDYTIVVLKSYDCVEKTFYVERNRSTYLFLDV